jgi:hypothetical protein
MVRALVITVAFTVVALATIQPLHAGRRSRDTDTNQMEIRLNKRQVAALDVVLAEMHRRGERFRGWQIVMRDEGLHYSIAFMEDPLDMTTTGGDGMSWRVRKRDLKLSGPT